MEVADRRELEEQKSEHSDSILYSLLFFDGLMMVNIEFVSILTSFAQNIGLDLSKLLFSILQSSFIENSSKEIASHLLSGVLSFVNPDNVLPQNFHRIILWTYQHVTLNK